MSIRPEVIPFLIGVIGLFGGVGILLTWLKWRRAAGISYVLGVVMALFMLFFFRDPERVPPSDPSVIVAGADGTIFGVKEVQETQLLKTNAVRISIFLSLLDVHVNRSPISGKVAFAEYYPGKRYFTFQEKSSEFNQHSSILIEGPSTKCLVNQIVGPVARRVVYWLKVDQTLTIGEKIGMMKFGSRMDLYLPQADVEVVVKEGDKVTAGVTPVARLKPKLEHRP
ncbi:MAG: phosphatidylserine decarboxylase family protein [Lentisphaerae bacterium]|nr:phosphatidylserine decarboxylase family protein [Lentisphaerota bacterium]